MSGSSWSKTESPSERSASPTRIGSLATYVVPSARSAHLIGLGFIDTDHGPVMARAMTARRKYLR